MKAPSCAKLQREFLRFAKKEPGRVDALPCLSIAYFQEANRRGCSWSKTPTVRKRAALLNRTCGGFRGYEEAPATKLLATHCAVCARPLVDAKSVETGIGPICAAKHGMDQACDPEIRAEANKLVYEIARHQTGPKAEAAARRLREIGFEVLSKKVMKRLKARHTENVRITDAGNEYHVYLPWYGRGYVEAFKREIPRRWWLPDKKMWAVPKTARHDLLRFLQKHNAGQIIIGSKGPFTV